MKYFEYGRILAISLTMLTAASMAGAYTLPFIVSPQGVITYTPGRQQTPVTSLPACDFQITSPTNGSALSSGTPVSVSITSTATASSNWINYYANPPATPLIYRASGPDRTTTTSLGTLVAGSWTITAIKYGTVNGVQTQMCPGRVVSITTSDSPPAPTAGQIPGLDGSASSLVGSPDTNIANYGHYNAAGGSGAGTGLIGGPLLTDLQAAQKVVMARKSAVEVNAQCSASAPDAVACPHGSQNSAANAYYEAVAVPNPSTYMTQINAFRSAYSSSAYGGAMWRIDGACPLVNPTTAMVLQWAANKWGINPVLMYAEATQESRWDQASLGDTSDGIGTSSGIVQVADRNTVDSSQHAPPGFTGPSANLARENTCFNADFYSAQLWSVFYGHLTNGQVTPAGNIGAAIQAWFTGMWGATSAGSYTQAIYNHITSQDWIANDFQGQSVPY